MKIPDIAPISASNKDVWSLIYGGGAPRGVNLLRSLGYPDRTGYHRRTTYATAALLLSGIF